jgi:hypothetical protein
MNSDSLLDDRQFFVGLRPEAPKANMVLAGGAIGFYALPRPRSTPLGAPMCIPTLRPHLFKMIVNTQNRVHNPVN